MASHASPSLPHRTVSTIRTGGSGTGPGSGAGGGPGASARGGSGSGFAAPSTPGGPSGASGNPRTPLRTTPSAFASPSTVRAEEETIVIEVGARQLRVGLAGDAVYRGTVAFGPEQQRRVGDLRIWQGGRRRQHLDVRRVDTGLVADKLERALRDAFTRYLMIDSRPRRMVVVLPPGLPIPLISTTLDTLFGRFQSPSVSLSSAPAAAAVAAGLRSALVVDLGWAETVVTSVYEYREVACTRTVRAGRMLVQQVHDLLARELSVEYRQQDEEAQAASRTLAAAAAADETSKSRPHLLSFEECEDVTARLVWCRPAAVPGPSQQTANNMATPGAKNSTAAAMSPIDGGLATVTETDETEEEGATSSTTIPTTTIPTTTIPTTTNTNTKPNDTALYTNVTAIPLHSCSPPTTLHLTFDQLAAPCETTFLGGTAVSGTGNGKPEADVDDGRDIPASWDDDEMPVPLLIVRHLLRLPVDVRAACLARVVFVGGCANVLGLRGRLFDEVARLVAAAAASWTGVRGAAVAQILSHV
ncbi:actin-related protein [Niveomyces insectorum RCEF 264]|uniref:Actin-related protein n=1 Tax=Niveomyces insectorum RCEF 264 TaxID=1081102 RepID=A0A167ZT68_9HYPO|nr:actin-related protein [Niveomyces insectorum RCEF 264]